MELLLTIDRGQLITPISGILAYSSGPLTQNRTYCEEALVMRLATLCNDMLLGYSAQRDREKAEHDLQSRQWHADTAATTLAKSQMSRDILPVQDEFFWIGKDRWILIRRRINHGNRLSGAD
jgi:hypothetical protein